MTTMMSKSPLVTSKHPHHMSELGLALANLLQYDTIQYNIDISLMIFYLTNILTILPASQEPSFTKFCTVNFKTFAKKEKGIVLT